MGQALGCVRVNDWTVGIRESFGNFDGALGPGWHFVPSCCCCGKSIVGYLNLRPQKLNVRCETKTKDNVSVTVETVIKYRVLAEKAYDAFYNVKHDAKHYMEQYFCDVIPTIIPNLMLDAVIEGKNDIAKTLENKLKEFMNQFGYDILPPLTMKLLELKYFARKAIMDDMNFSGDAAGPSVREPLLSGFTE